MLQPESARDPALADSIRRLEPDLSVVVAYGHILPRAIIEMPARGTINIHASLLPALRGAAPIQSAIREGLSETGISIMRMVPALDAGPVILRARTPMPADETYGELQVRLSELGALALIEALALMELGESDEQPQDDSLATYAPKVDRGTTRIDWSADAAVVCNVVRAYDPQPGAWSTFAGSDIKLFGAHPVTGVSGSPGELLVADGGALVVACGTAATRLTEVQPAGKRRMTASEWRRGHGDGGGHRFV